MGCILEFFFEIVVEGLFELVGYCYLKLMTLIAPNKTFTERTKRVIKAIAITFSVILAITILIGLIMLIQEDPVVRQLGKRLIYIPLIIMAAQIILGIIVRIFDRG